MTSFEVYKRLTKKGRRRAAVMYAVSMVLWSLILYAGGYLACAVAAGMEKLAGV